jgi:hypothetical protein
VKAPYLVGRARVSLATWTRISNHKDKEWDLKNNLAIIMLYSDILNIINYVFDIVHCF